MRLPRRKREAASSVTGEDGAGSTIPSGGSRDGASGLTGASSVGAGISAHAGRDGASGKVSFFSFSGTRLCVPSIRQT